MAKTIDPVLKNLLRRWDQLPGKLVWRPSAALLLARGAGSSVSHRGMFRVQVGALGELIPRWGCPQSRAAELMELCVEEEDAQHHRGIKTAVPEHCPRWQGKVSLYSQLLVEWQCLGS